MFTRKVLVSALFAAGMLGAAVIPLPSAAAADIVVEVGPPTPPVEVVPVPRPGYIWSPGYHRYENGRYVWVSGEWIRERATYAYVPNRWVEREGRWYFEPGYWDRR